MALKLPDSAVPMGDFPVAKAVDIDFNDGENLQEKLDNGKLGGDNSTHKTVIFENNIDMGKYLLLAKITNANYSNNIIKFSCPNYKGVNDAGFKYENDMDIYKFELHFNTGSMRENNSYGVTLKQHGLVLYSYPLSNPKNTEPRLEEAIRLYWDYSKGDIYVFLVDIMTAIPHCVLEYTGSGTLIRNNTFVMDDLYNRRDGKNGTWQESKWKSIPYNKLETPPIYELGGNGGSGSADGSKTFTSLNALGLTADATVEDVVSALKNGESFLAPVNTFTNYETIFPNKVPNDQWNKIHIIKGMSLPNSHIRCFSQSGACEYLANVNNTNIVSWNDVSGTYIDITDSIVEKLGNEILKYPVGKYRINSTTTGNKFTDLPFNVGIIEINGTSVGKSPFTDTWVYRMYKFECLIGTLSYIRRLNSGATAGQIESDTGWCAKHNIYTSLKELGLDTTTATINNIIGAMKDGTTFTYKTDVFDYATEYNNIQFGTVTINKQSTARVQALMTDKDTGNLYVGRLNSTNQIVGWRKIITEMSDPYACTSYTALTGTEDLFTLPCGHYVSATINTAYNYPITDSSNVTAHVYVLGHLNDLANNKGYRIILYSDNKNRMYSINEWWGSFANGWQKIATQKDLDDLFQSVSSGKTLVANAITGKGVSTATDATFATMANNINRISAYKEETKSLIVTSGTTGTEALKFTFSANVIAVKKIVAPSDSCHIVPQTSKDMLTINGKELIVHVTGTGTWKVTALIEK